LCVNLLLQYGAVSDPTEGTSPLKAALNQRSNEDNEDNEDIKIINIVRLLILAGAKLDSSDTDIYGKLLYNNGYHNNHPFRLRSICLQKVAPFANKGSPEKNAKAVDQFELPLDIATEFYNEDKSVFFKYSS
jgi:hypothetical protein